MEIEFWFDPASTYAYLSAMRIEDLAAAAGIEVVWRPFLLGPIFAAQGWNTSPFNIYPAKGRYMARDLERCAADRGLPPFKVPDPFPSYSLHAARLAMAGADRGWVGPFARALFTAQFADGADIADEAVLRRALAAAEVTNADTVLASAVSPENKAALRAQTETAQALGIFGAPTFVTTGGEIFWGDDRLEQALSWAKR